MNGSPGSTTPGAPGRFSGSSGTTRDIPHSRERRHHLVRPPKGGLMDKPYTHTTWRVRAGSEDEFVRRWSEWVDWSHREGLEAPALLLRDLENPQAFIS